MSGHDMRLNILGDAHGAKNALSDVEKAAAMAADKITHSFTHAGSIIKKSIGWVTVGAGLEMALESASKLNNQQKVQSQLLENTAKSQKGLIDLKKYELEGNKNAWEWKSKYLDQMATQLSLQNGIDKNQIVQAQTTLIQNADIMKFYKEGHKYLKGNGDLMNMTLTEAANIAEVTHGSITSSAMTLSRAMADPAKRMAMLYKMKIQLSKAEQQEVKNAQAKNGLAAGQAKLLEMIDKHYKDIAKNAQSPIEMLKNQISLVWQSLGQGLLPILDALANVLADKNGPVQALIPVLQAMGATINTVSKSLGASMGTILSAFIPFVQLMTNAIIPALLNVFAPIMGAIAKIAKPLGDQFAKLVGTTDNLGPLAKVFIDLSNAIVKGIQPGLNAIVASFNQLNNSGKLKELLMGMVDAFTKLMPILPAMGEAFTSFLLAVTPIIVASLPFMVKIFGLFAMLLTSVVVPVMKAVTGFFTKLHHSMGGATKVLGALLGLWFTRKLFIAPIQLVGGMIEKLIGRFGALKSAASGFKFGESVKNFLMPGRAQRIAANQLSGGYSGHAALAGIADPAARAAMQTNIILNEIGIGMNRLVGYANVQLTEIVAILEYGMTPGGSRQGPPPITIDPATGAPGAAPKSSKWGKFGRVAGRIGRSGIGRGIAGGVAGIGISMGLSALSNMGDQKNHIPSKVGTALNVVSGVAGFLGPWGMAFSAIIQGVMLLYNKFDWFRLGVNKIGRKIAKIWHDVWSTASKQVNMVRTSISNLWNRVLQLGRSTKEVAQNIAHDVAQPFKNMWHQVQDWIGNVKKLWNNTLGGFSMHLPKWLGGYGFTIPKFHSGGIVPGTTGKEVPAILQAGEAVTSIKDMQNLRRGGNGGGMSVQAGAVNITINGNADAQTVAQIERTVNKAFNQLLTKATIHK